jgi:prokaryotic membrane lipoprotein lipid attachment site
MKKILFAFVVLLLAGCNKSDDDNSSKEIQVIRNYEPNSTIEKKIDEPIKFVFELKNINVKEESLKFFTTKSYILSQNSSTDRGDFGRFYEGENGDVVIDEKEVMGTDRGEGIIRNQTLYITYVPKKEGKHEINIGFKRESPSKEFYFPYTIVCKK